MKLKNIIGAFLALALIASVMPLAVAADAPASVFIGSVELSDGEYLAVGASEPASEAPAEGGYASYIGGVLTLNNFTYEGSGYEYYSYSHEYEGTPYVDSYSAAVYIPGDAQVVIAGENTVHNTYTSFESDESVYYICSGDGIYFEGNGTVTGEGSLEVYGNRGICGQKLAVDCASLYIETLLAGITVENFGTAAELTVSCGELVINSGEDGIALDSSTNAFLTFEGGNTAITAPYGIYSYTYEAAEITVNGANVAIVGEYIGIRADLTTVNSGELAIEAAAEEEGVAVVGEVVLGEGMNVVYGSADGVAVIINDGAMYGDVHLDGVVDMYDYMLVKSIYFGKYEASEEELARADVYADGNIDMYDYMVIKSIYFENAADIDTAEEKAFDEIAAYIVENGVYAEEYYSIDITETADDGSIVHYMLETDADKTAIAIYGGYESADGNAVFMAALNIERGVNEAFVVAIAMESEETETATGSIPIDSFDFGAPAINDFVSNHENTDDAAAFEERVALTLADTIAYLDFYLFNNGTADLIDLGFVGMIG